MLLDKLYIGSPTIAKLQEWLKDYIAIYFHLCTRNQCDRTSAQIMGYEMNNESISQKDNTVNILPGYVS